jgi:tRNA (mo5U34)-methyltransferase
VGSRRLRSRPRYLAPVEVKDIDVYDVSPETVGTFDIVLFTGVLYHSRHPLLALECAASVCAGTLVEADFPLFRTTSGQILLHCDGLGPADCIG